MESILRGLNVAQKAAVTSSAAILQVLAPPGSGKTKTLTSRVAYLLAHHGYAPWNVICCTFTIKASREMRERLQGMIGHEQESKLILGTFHSICRRYLVSYGHLIGLPENFGIADSDDSLKIIKRAIKRLNLSIDAKSARSRISHRKARGKRLDDVPRSGGKNIEAQEFATICHEYEDELATSNLLDYDDLLLRCVDLLHKHPGCVSNVEALLIDEFQDTNVVQFELMKLLASAKRRITIVGDPDQSIYGFRSAEIENLRRMKAFYPGTVVINLEENYRSSSAVLRLAQEVIEQDNDRPDKKLKSTHVYGTLPVLRRVPNRYEEGHWIASEIKRMTSLTGDLLQYSDIAILLRSSFLSLQIEKALASIGIPYRMVGGRRFFDRPEIRLLLDYLRTISHPDNASALLAVINLPKRKIGDATISELTRYAEEHRESLWNVIKKAQSGSLAPEKKVSKAAEQGLRELVSLVTRAHEKMKDMVPVEAPSKLIRHVISQLKYQDYLKREYPEDHGERWENVNELLTQASDPTLQFNVSDEDLPEIDGVAQQQANGSQEVLARFLANVVLSTEVEGADGEEQQRVTLSTIHSAKGLEWPVVFVPGVFEGSIPHSRAEDTSEERRLFYVALTRAQALLYMTFPLTQQNESESILSQFLPPKINPMVSQIGTVFHDRVVEDIASILRRSAPSQESLARGLQSLKNNESAEDDVWPADGSHKRSQVAEGTYSSPFVLQPGQSLSDAMKGPGSYNQKSNYSTISFSAPTTMNPSSAYSTSNLSLGFTTANNHLKTLPQLPEPTLLKPTLTKSTTDPSGLVVKRPKLTKTASNQGNIASFFSQGTLKPKQEPAVPTSGILQEEIKSRHSGLRTGSMPSSKSSAKSATATIPAELSSHKLSNAASKSSRPRFALGSASVSGLNQDQLLKRNHYSAFLSSPSRSENDDDDGKEEKTLKNATGLGQDVHVAHQNLTAITSTNTKPLPTTATSTTHSSVLHRTTMSMLNAGATTSSITTNSDSNNNPHKPQQRPMMRSQSTRLVGLDTLYGFQQQHSPPSSSSITANTMTTSTTMSTTTTHAYSNQIVHPPDHHQQQRKKTLGVRRSMNGWGDRKHK